MLLFHAAPHRWILENMILITEKQKNKSQQLVKATRNLDKPSKLEAKKARRGTGVGARRAALSETNDNRK